MSSFKDFLKFFCLFSLIFGVESQLLWAVDRWIVIDKAQQSLSLYYQGQEVLSFPCSFGMNPVEPKRTKGDLATPEGLYRVVEKHPSKRYHLFVGLDYPNLKDIKRAYWSGIISDRVYQRYLTHYQKGRFWAGPLGSQIGIHGGGLYRPGRSKRVRNWTHGCIALRDEDMQLVYRFVKKGTPVLIWDSRKPLFEILQELVVPEFADRKYWQARLQIPLERYSLDLDFILLGGRDGSRSLEVVGLERGSQIPLFYIRDLNGNGILEPLDRFYSKQSFPWKGYRFLQVVILQTLPKKVVNFLSENESYH